MDYLNLFYLNYSSKYMIELFTNSRNVYNTNKTTNTNMMIGGGGNNNNDNRNHNNHDQID